MAHQNMISDMEGEQGHALVHPGNHRLGGSANDFPNYTVQLVRSSAIPTADSYGFHGYYDVGTNGQNPCNYVRTCRPLVNRDLGPVIPSTFSSFGMSASSSSRSVPVSHTFGMGNVLPLSVNHHQAAASSDSENERSDHFSDNSRNLSKRKNVDSSVGNSALINVSTSPSSSSYASRISGLQQWDPSFEPFSVSAVPAAFNSWQPIEGPPRSALINSSTFHPEYAQPSSYHWPGSYVGQCFQAPSNMWSAPACNSIAEAPPQWNLVHLMSNPQGAISIPANADGVRHEFQNNVNQGFVPYFHQHPMHMMPLPGLIDHSQASPSYLQPMGANPSSQCIRPRFVPVVPNTEPVFGLPRGPLPANLGISHGNLRILPTEHSALMDISRLYEVASVIDEHRDLRLDIDTMTYEDLLALEEQIGDVSTGLSEEFVLDNLRTSQYRKGFSNHRNQHELPLEDESCIICQVEFHTGECIGTLDCGHQYHVDCIKQWLMLKNLCPICKTTAVPPKRKDG